MLNLSTNGQRIGEEAKLIQVVEMTWETWKILYPDSFIMSTDTGFSRNYDIYPYGSYKTNDNLLFPVSNTDSRLHKKARVLGLIVGDRTKVFPISEFLGGLQVINENFNGTDVVVIGSAALNLAVSFLRTLSDGTNLTFTSVDGELPVLVKNAKVLPLKRNGKKLGFQIDHLPIHSILFEFGIIQGDIIRTINGSELKGLKPLFDLLESLPELEYVEIGIERNNQTLKLVINLE